ncbi:glucosaminidase domain-containing protein [Conexibacter sp. W3-3-2]|uniref:glucosaminidase domain-containing protein n=1 Tax=Conexibacter sp. W3-3-2 TaxID=2675227 RepID=UPI0018AAB360|nr:glucosaminidase domain-containing protein [Conexibacter sp. W3-3-2]
MEGRARAVRYAAAHRNGAPARTRRCTATCARGRVRPAPCRVACCVLPPSSRPPWRSWPLAAPAAATTGGAVAPRQASAPAPQAPTPLTPGPATTTTAPSLALRAAPAGRLLARLARGTRVTVECQRNGPLATTAAGATRVWARVRTATGRRGYVSDGYLATRTSALVAPYCGIGAAGPDPAVAGQGRCGPVSPFALIPPFADARQFVTAVAPAAQASRDTYGVPPSVTLAQAVLETGGGKVAALANNFFGMKAQSVAASTWRWEDLAGGCVFKKTWEVRAGRSATEIAAFRAYPTLEASVLDHGRRLATNPAYAAAFQHADDPVRFLREIARRYATDPAYADKLLDLRRRYALAQYD